MFFQLGGNWYFVLESLVTADAKSASAKLQERLDKEKQGARFKNVTHVDLTAAETTAITALLSDGGTILLTNR